MLNYIKFDGYKAKLKCRIFKRIIFPTHGVSPKACSLICWVLEFFYKCHRRISIGQYPLQPFGIVKKASSDDSSNFWIL